jgi:hypothetical protein
MKKHRPKWITGAFVLLLAVGGAGCGRPADPAVATANSGAPKTGAGAAADGEKSLLKFSQCMRDQGLTWFPDPQPDGGLVVHNPDGVDQSKFDKADQACQKYYPSGSGGGPIPAEDLAKIRQVSQCVRDHGFAKYPDPDANGSISIDSKVLGVEPTDATFVKAMQECAKYLPAPKSSKASS